MAVSLLLVMSLTPPTDALEAVALVREGRLVLIPGVLVRRIVAVRLDGAGKGVR